MQHANVQGGAAELLTPVERVYLPRDDVQVLRFRGDRVASFHLAFDRAEMMEQLGVAPSAPAEEAPYRRGEAAPQPAQPH